MVRTIDKLIALAIAAIIETVIPKLFFLKTRELFAFTWFRLLEIHPLNGKTFPAFRIVKSVYVALNNNFVLCVFEICITEFTVGIILYGVTVPEYHVYKIDPVIARRFSRYLFLLHKIPNYMPGSQCINPFDLGPLGCWVAVTAVLLWSSLCMSSYAHLQTSFYPICRSRIAGS